MIKKTFAFVLATLILASLHPAEAQQAKKVPTIGIPSTGSTAAVYEPFIQGLRELGYVQGKNIFVEYRYAEGKPDRLAELAAELVQLEVDVIFAGSTPPALAAKKATQTIPIVFAGASDPLGSGLVASLARPGGNITGLSLVPGLEIIGKQLELLKESLPKLRSVAALADTANIPTSGFLTEAKLAARSLGVQLQPQNVRDPNEFDGAFSAIKKGRTDALLVIASPMFNNIANRSRIISFATSNRLPAMYPYSDFVNAGGLVSYGPNLPDLFRRAATYVDKILKGAKPADLPVEQPTKFELVINLKTAKQIGVTIPPSMLYRADKVIR
jgi:putative ABC transport system substrate-binding protein